MRILLLKRGEQPVGLHAARQGRLRALSKGGDLESVTLTSVKIYPESRRFWPRFPLRADSVTLGPILGQLTAHGWIPIRADACRRIWELRSASTLHLDVAAVPHRQRLVRGMLKLLATAVVAGTAHQLQRQHRWSVCIMCAASPR
jgi:hypothetical protein